MILLAAIVAVLALVAAKADAQVYCVDNTDASRSAPHFDGNLQGALNAASANPGPDTVLIGSDILDHAAGYSYTNTSPGNSVSVIGSGPGQTVLTGFDTTKTVPIFQLHGETG